MLSCSTRSSLKISTVCQKPVLRTGGRETGISNRLHKRQEMAQLRGTQFGVSSTRCSAHNLLRLRVFCLKSRISLCSEKKKESGGEFYNYHPVVKALGIYKERINDLNS